LTTGSDDHYYPDYYFFVSPQSCKEAYKSWTKSSSIAGTLCGWYSQNSENNKVFEQMIADWEETGNLLNDQKKIPFAPSTAQYIG